MKQNLYKGVNQKPTPLQSVPRPADCFKFPIQIRDSDTDYLRHVNQASYFLYFMDAATEGANLGHFRVLKGDLLSYPIESMECAYRGECAPGDEVVVYLWEIDKLPYMLFCHIEKKGNVIWEGNFRFSSVIDAKL